MNGKSISPRAQRGSRSAASNESRKRKFTKKGTLRSPSSTRTISLEEEEAKLSTQSLQTGESPLVERKNISEWKEVKDWKEALQNSILEKAQKLDQETYKKVKIICHQQSNVSTPTIFTFINIIRTLKKLDEDLDSLANNSNNRAAKERINELFCPALTIEMNKIPKKYHAEIFINERAKFIASLLIDSSGNINTEIIDTIKDLINTPPLLQGFSKIHDNILLKTLDILKEGGELIELLNNLGEPGKNLSKWDPNKQQIESSIRATLGLEERIPLTAMHSKQALLSALLTDLRQGDVGSCFATSIAIMIHDQKPLQMAIELKQIIENGKFEKIINGELEIFSIPKISIPKTAMEEVDKKYLEDTSFNTFLKDPGIARAIAITGLNISKKKERLKLLEMFNEVLDDIDDPKQLKKVIRGFLDELAMYKNGINMIDLSNKTEYEKKFRKYSRLKEKLEKAQPSEEKTLLLHRIEEIHQEMNELQIYFDQKFGVGSDLKNKFDAYNEFKQKLEMNYQDARGENTLLKIWEYSMAFKGNSNIMESLTNTLTYTTSDSWTITSYIMNTIEWLFEDNIQEKKIIIRNASVPCIVDQILNETEDPDNTFDKIQFRNEFDKHFKAILAKRLEIRYEEGHFKFYDKTRATTMELSVLLENPQAICDAIFSIAYQAAEKINAGNPQIKDEVIDKLNSALRKPKFFKDLVKALMLSKNYSFSSLTDADWKLISSDNSNFEQIIRAQKGGWATKVLEKYIDSPLENRSFSGNPENFITEIVTQLDTMINQGALDNIDPNTEIIFPLSLRGHACLFRPDMTMLTEIMKDPTSTAVEAWIQKTLIDEKQTFIVGDLNWMNNGRHQLLAIKYDDINSRLSFFTISEPKESNIPEEYPVSYDSFTVHFFQQTNV